jgi:hypothetical protein
MDAACVDMQILSLTSPGPVSELRVGQAALQPTHDLGVKLRFSICL